MRKASANPRQATRLFVRKQAGGLPETPRYSNRRKRIRKEKENRTRFLEENV